MNNQERTIAGWPAQYKLTMNEVAQMSKIYEFTEYLFNSVSKNQTLRITKEG